LAQFSKLIDVLVKKTKKAKRAADYISRYSRLAASRKVAFMDRKHGGSDKGLEENLASAVHAADSELEQILQEVEAISEVLKSKNPDSQILRVAGHHAVWTAVKQALLDREMRYLALTDDLTCLFNRRGFFAAATQQLRMARRGAQDMLLFFCDVDGLKKINDTYGHKKGDIALIRVADALERTFRSSDVIARLGGDEFLVLTSGSPSQTQGTILRRLEKSLKKSNCVGPCYELSLSIGAARFDPKRPVTLGELIAEADRAMYSEKQKRQSAAEMVRGQSQTQTASASAGLKNQLGEKKAASCEGRQSPGVLREYRETATWAKNNGKWSGKTRLYDGLGIG
jgi:diguanylate cyclase (GGDEF)-like protein